MSSLWNGHGRESSRFVSPGVFARRLDSCEQTACEGKRRVTGCTSTLFLPKSRVTLLFWCRDSTYSRADEEGEGRSSMLLLECRFWICRMHGVKLTGKSDKHSGWSAWCLAASQPDREINQRLARLLGFAASSRRRTTLAKEFWVNGRYLDLREGFKSHASVWGAYA